MSYFTRFSQKTLRTGALVLVASVFSAGALFTNVDTLLLRTSLVDLPQHAPFDGTVYPVAKVPNWVSVDSTRWTLPFTELSENELVKTPFYDPVELSTKVENLVWGNPSHDRIRNKKITYSVVYEGNYMLDGVEGAGSHPAVDIKVPLLTPVSSIMNGVVVKVSNQSGGFGHHVVVRSENVPTLDNPNQTTVLFCSYSHLGDIFVKEFDVVTKGQLIANSGKTGTATTPHVHFQCDNENAPWHPFWPFDFKEAVNAGLDFFSAINAGLGIDKVKSTTVNPLKYVQTYLEYNAGFVANSNLITDVTEANDSVEDVVPVDVVVPEVVVGDDPVSEAPVVDNAPRLVFEFSVKPEYGVKNGGEFVISLRDQFGNIFKPYFPGELIVSSSLGNFTASSAILLNNDFDSEGNFKNSFKRLEAGSDRIKIEYNGEVYYSDSFVIKDFVLSFSDLDKDNVYYDAILKLAEKGIVKGYPDGTFRPENTVSRVEALKFIFEGISQVLSEGDLPFSDVSVSEWYAKYLYTAYNGGVVNGYDDGTFKPSLGVNKAEFYKILFSGMGIDVNPNVNENPFLDVSKDEWFAPYFALAKDMGIIDSVREYVNPADAMSRGEVADAIWRLMNAL